MIVIIDYKMGNLGSIENMLKRIGVPALISNDRKDLESADRLILPGVGAFDSGMTHLQEAGIIPVLNELVLTRKKPILGVCLGMQLLTYNSEEGKLPGLGWIKGRTVRFKFAPDEASLKIPHMGWNTVQFRPEARLSKGLDREARFYFVHSYHVVCEQEENIAGETIHGYRFSSVVQQENIFGVQFHPEKSHKFGLQLLKNFVEYN